MSENVPVHELTLQGEYRCDRCGATHPLDRKNPQPGIVRREECPGQKSMAVRLGQFRTIKLNPKANAAVEALMRQHGYTYTQALEHVLEDWHG